MALALRFAGDAIVGEGSDPSGPFTMRGEVDPDGETVYLIKGYPRFDVRYDGRWNGTFLAGRSGLVPPAWGLPGTFELWPEDEESALDLTEARIVAPEPVPA